ncbi:MAG TPA: F0F1 ATP synthase subunit delta [Bradyrhizobium sp.]|nr:F0F1 ATP synthase subunit delta [Bradyrhizobium sp.]
MLIDWFTVGAQVLNFLILMWLLKRYLYKPILRAIDARETRIAGELANAKAKKDEAQSECDEFRRKNADFDRQRAELLRQATEDAKVERQQLLDAARKESETLRAKLQENLRSEHRSLAGEITSRIQRDVFAIVRKTLADLATASLEGRMADVFVGRLLKLSSAEKQALISATAEAAQPVLLRSAFDLPPRQRLVIDTAVKETLGPETELRFETVPDIIGGVELSVNGHKLAWSIRDYLTSLADHIGEVLERKAERRSPEPNSAPEMEQRTAENAAG